MRVSVAAALAGVALIALAACNKPAPGAPGTTTTAAAPGPISASQLPHRKPGLWRQVIAMDGAAPSGPGTQLCVDEATEAKMSAFAQQMPAGVHCPPPEFTRALDGSVRFSESCDVEKVKVATTGVIRGDFNSGFTEEMDTQYSGSPVAALNGEHKMTVTATWLGPCAPGQRGGDLILANGMKRNILDDRRPTPPSGGN